MVLNMRAAVRGSSRFVLVCVCVCPKLPQGVPVNTISSLLSMAISWDRAFQLNGCRRRMSCAILIVLVGAMLLRKWHFWSFCKVSKNGGRPFHFRCRNHACTVILLTHLSCTMTISNFWILAVYHSLIATQRFIAFLWRACSNVASPCGHEVCIEHRKSSGDSSGSSFEAQRAKQVCQFAVQREKRYGMLECASRGGSFFGGGTVCLNYISVARDCRGWPLLLLFWICGNAVVIDKLCAGVECWCYYVLLSYGY